MRPLLRPFASPLRSWANKPTTTTPSIITHKPTSRRLLFQQQRTFLPGLSLSSTNSSSITQSISATRTLPYPPKPLYKIISDIDAYSIFLPYVLSSKVIERHPTTHSPTSADLRIGFNPIDETFRSKVTCEEPSIVEADASGNGVFETLKTRWEIHPASEAGGSVVDLKIDIGFSNPLYATLTQAVVPKVATVMIDAFEKRAKELLEKNDEGVQKVQS